MKSIACLRENAPLAGLTSLGIGGPARWLAEPAEAGELRDALAWAGDSGLEARVIGGGCNLLAADSGVAGLTIRLSPRSGFGAIEKLADRPLRWRVGAAVELPRLLGRMAENGAAGLEFLAGIPGALGGAAAMNAGGAEKGIGEFLAEAEFFRFDGKETILRGGDLAFGYREGPLRDGVAASFALQIPSVDDSDAIRTRMRRRLEEKRRSQPLEMASAGCVFRNPPGVAAGILLDRAGCKGMREGGAEVSARHANFIVNAGGATARQVARLACRMRRAVLETGGPRLRPEIILWGEEPEFAELTGDAA